MNEILKYTCPKCGNKQYEVGEMWAFSNLWTKILQIHSRRFTFVSCRNCHFTEFFKVHKKDIGEVFNFLIR